jgi:hypothetical protein
MTRPHGHPRATTHGPAPLPTASSSTTGGRQPATALATQTHALRALADFLDHHGVDDLYLTLNSDRISIQVPANTGTAVWRASVVTHLATALGWVAHVRAPRLAGHEVRIYTPTKENTR